MQNTFHLRWNLVEIALLDVGKTETSRNQAPWIKKLWPATSYGAEGFANREPYCAAGQCYLQQQWLKDPAVLAALGMTAAQAEVWRCKSAAAFGWLEWARDKNLLVFHPGDGTALHTGDIMVFEKSHIELVVDDTHGLQTIGYNTGSDLRDGEGCCQKRRNPNLARAFIRVLA